MRTANISVDKCVPKQPGRAIDDLFWRDGSLNNAGVCSSKWKGVGTGELCWQMIQWQRAALSQGAERRGGKKNSSRAESVFRSEGVQKIMHSISVQLIQSVDDKCKRKPTIMYLSSVEVTLQRVPVRIWHHPPWRACAHGNRSLRKALCKVLFPTILPSFC